MRELAAPEVEQTELAAVVPTPVEVAPNRPAAPVVTALPVRVPLCRAVRLERMAMGAEAAEAEAVTMAAVRVTMATVRRATLAVAAVQDTTTPPLCLPPL